MCMCVSVYKLFRTSLYPNAAFWLKERDANKESRKVTLLLSN